MYTLINYFYKRKQSHEKNIVLVKSLKKIGYFWTVKGKIKHDRFLVTFGQQRIEFNLEKVDFFPKSADMHVLSVRQDRVAHKWDN